METRRIVVPSRKRARNIPRILSMLPNATITVAESEASDYAGVVPKKQLLLHPELKGLAAIRNWLGRTLQEDCLVEIDDDLRGVIPQLGKAKRITDPAVIAELIENGHRMAEDLGIGVFCWSRTANNFLSDPIVSADPVCPARELFVRDAWVRLAIGCGMRRFPAGPTWTSR